MTIGKASELSNRLSTLANVANAIKPLAVIKYVVVEGLELKGYRAIYKSVHMCTPGDELVLTGYYKNQRNRPILADLLQEFDGNRVKHHVLFMPQAPYQLEMKFKVSEPKKYVAKAEARPRIRPLRPRGLVREVLGTDVASYNYPVGLFDDRPKPVSEYPVAGVDNVRLDVAYSFRAENKAYPTPLPSGLAIDGMSVSAIEGVVVYAGKWFKDPNVNNVIRVSARIMNNTGSSVTIKHWGLPLSVLYEDNMHVSQVNVSISFPDKTIPHGQSYSYYLDVPIPGWAYGRIAIAHALKVYKDGTFVYGGGPLWQFELGRLRMP